MEKINFKYKTQKAYELERKNEITFAMEDYIEMIYRENKKNIKSTEIAKLLNINPSSVTKMLQKLKNLELVEYEKYREINLTNKGYELGKYLFERHNMLLKLFDKINNEDSSYLVEQIEHFFSFEQIKKIEEFLKKEDYI